MFTMMDFQGKVVGIEHIPELVEKSKANLNKSFNYHIESEDILILQGDGRMGCEDHALYDCIHVGAAIEEIPEQLTNQLAPDGIMVIPLGSEGGKQRLTFCYKNKEGKLHTEDLMGVCYVPLTSQRFQLCRM